MAIAAKVIVLAMAAILGAYGLGPGTGRRVSLTTAKFLLCLFLLSLYI